MPRYAGYNRVRTVGGSVVQGSYPQRNDYKSLQTAQRRHDYSAGAPNTSLSPTTLTGEAFFGVTLCRFKRSFSGVADTPPTATVGNNYQSPDVFNGSLIRDLDAYIRITNKSNTDPAILTVYEFALSYFDVFNWLIIPANCPFTFDSSGGVNSGEVDWANPVVGSTLSENQILNRKFLQHYAKKVGEITLGLETSGSETAEIRWKGVPPKCRRSNSGMFYGYAFVNDSDKNEGRTLSMDYAFRNHFIEIPSENRLPWLA